MSSSPGFHGHDAYPRAIRNVFGNWVVHRTKHYLNNHLEQDHRGIKQRYRPMCGLKTFATAARFCGVFDEIRAFLRPQAHRNHFLTLAQQRDIHREGFAHVMGIIAAAKPSATSSATFSDLSGARADRTLPPRVPPSRCATARCATPGTATGYAPHGPPTATCPPRACALSGRMFRERFPINPPVAQEPSEGLLLDGNKNLGGRPELPDSRLGARGRDIIHAWPPG